jgi:hypothetical protein
MTQLTKYLNYPYIHPSCTGLYCLLHTPAVSTHYSRSLLCGTCAPHTGSCSRSNALINGCFTLYTHTHTHTHIHTHSHTHTLTHTHTHTHTHTLLMGGKGKVSIWESHRRIEWDTEAQHTQPRAGRSIPREQTWSLRDKHLWSELEFLLTYRAWLQGVPVQHRSLLHFIPFIWWQWQWGRRQEAQFLSCR